MIREYRNIEGEYPDDRLAKGVAMNAKNSNAEALFLALFDSRYTGSRPSQEWLVNTDGDEANRDLTMLGTRALFEIGDEWGNPILYFESLHYSDESGCVALAGEDGYFEEDVVFAQRSSVTNSFYAPSDFQLVSAGPDGYFNTGMFVDFCDTTKVYDDLGDDFFAFKGNSPLTKESPGLLYQQWLANALMAMCVPPAEWENFTEVTEFGPKLSSPTKGYGYFYVAPKWAQDYAEAKLVMSDKLPVIT